MAITWTDFQSGDLLSTIRGKLNAFSNSVVTAVNTNITDIASNTASIATNTIDISEGETRLDNLESKVLFTPRFDYQKVTNFTVTTDTYSSITTLTTNTWEAGTYKLDLSMIYSLDNVNNSAYFRFRVNGSAWTEVRRETKDTTDLVPVSYTNLTTLVSSSPITVEIEGYKESIGDTLYIPELTVMVERKV